MRGKIWVVALCALLALAPAWVVADGVPEDTALLGLLLPGVQLAPADDFAYVITEPMPDGSFGPGTLAKVREVKRVGEDLLCVATMHGATHMEGYCDLVFAVYDPQTGALRGEPLRFAADKADYYLTCRDGVPGVLYIGSSAGQGIETYHGGMWVYEAAGWNKIWPTDDDYWTLRKGVISYDPPAAMELYARQLGEQAEYASDYKWEFEGYYEYGW